MGSSKKQPDATRQERKAKKRKLEDAVPDLPGDDDAVASRETAGKKRKRDRDAGAEEDEADAVIEGREEKKKGEKKEKKRRRKESEEGGVPIEEQVEGEAEKKEKKSKKEKKEKDSTAAEPVVATEAEDGPKKSKKERKAERKAKEVAEAAAKGKDAAAVERSNAAAETNGGSEPAEADKKSKKNNRNREKKRKGAATSGEGVAVNGAGEKDEGKGKKDARFICFVGNLPFTANTASVTKHFASVKPISVRALTKKDDPTKSKGIAFVEFDGYDHMKTCLKLLHHSMFDDGLSAPRKINVELTAGGGGNTKDRRAKIQEKNQKLNEQRARRIQEEAKAKLEKGSNAAAIDESAIHPSRRTLVPGA